MDTGIYIGTALLTVAWTVWFYIAWGDKADLSDESGLRFPLLIAPSLYFLLIALSGWAQALFIRLDLIGLVVYDALILFCWLAMLILHGRRGANYTKGYVILLSLFNILAIILTGAVHLIKLFPPLIIRLSNLFAQGVHLEFFKFAWIGLDPETHANDLAGMVNKIFIALLSYIPITLLRTLYISRKINRQQHQTAAEIRILRDKIEQLESKLKQRD